MLFAATLAEKRWLLAFRLYLNQKKKKKPAFFFPIFIPNDLLPALSASFLLCIFFIVNL